MDESEDSGPLDFSTTQELIDELAKRFDALVVISLRVASEEEEGTRAWYYGGQMTCLGLLNGTHARLLNDHVNGGEVES